MPYLTVFKDDVLVVDTQFQTLIADISGVDNPGFLHNIRHEAAAAQPIISRS